MDTKNEREAAPTGGPQDRRFRASSGWGPGVLAVVALVAVIGAAIWAVASGDRPSVRPEVTPAPVASTPSDAAVEVNGPTIYLWDPNTGAVKVVFSAPTQLADAELSPDGERVVYERGDLDGVSQIYLLRADGIERQLTDLPGGASDPTWSPEGGKIAFAASSLEGTDADILVIDADGSHIRRLVGTAGDDGAPDWSPDGSRIVFHARYDSTRSSIWVASIRTHALTRLIPRDVFGAMDPAWSPDGRLIAYSSYGGDTLNGSPYAAELWRVHADGTDKIRITKPNGQRVNENPSWSPDGRLIVFEEHDWDWDRNRVLVIDPKTGRVRSILAGAEAAVSAETAVLRARVGREGAGTAPSWGQEGILMSLPSGNPAPSQGPAPPGFRVDVPGVDATITITGSRCELGGVPGPIHPGRLKLELVNDSRLQTLVRVRRLRPGQTIAQLRADPPTVSFLHGRWTSEGTSPSGTRVWSSSRRIASGRWAVVCGKDELPGANGMSWVPVGVAGPIEVG